MLLSPCSDFDAHFFDLILSGNFDLFRKIGVFNLKK